MNIYERIDELKADISDEVMEIEHLERRLSEAENTLSDHRLELAKLEHAVDTGDVPFGMPGITQQDIDDAQAEYAEKERIRAALKQRYPGMPQPVRSIADYWLR